MHAASRFAQVLFALVLCAAGAAPARAQITITGIDSVPATPVVVAQSVAFSADASVPGGDALEYRWDFGDGSPRTAWLATPEVSHAYPTAGIFNVLLQVRHPAQGLASATTTLVVRLTPAVAARHSSGIVVHPTRREIWSVNPDHGSVSVLDADALTRIDEVVVGRHPASLAIDAAGQVWIAERDSDSLRRIDPVTRATSAIVELGYGAKPVAVAIAPDGALGYVALAGPGTVQRFVPTSAALGAELAVGAHVEALAIRGDNGALFVSRLVSSGAAGTVWRVALPAFAATEAIALPLDSTSPDSGTAARGLPNYVATLALAEDGRSLWYGGKKDNILRGMHREGQPLNFESVLRSLLGRVDAFDAMEQVGARLDLDDAGRVSALLLAPGSSHLFVAQETNNRVLVVDPWNRRELARFDVGRAPQALAFDPVTRRLLVQNFLSRSVSAFDVGDLLDDGASLPLPLGDIATTLAEVLSPQVLNGKRVFYNAQDVRISEAGYTTCAACHLDGRHDGRTWDFTQLGEGLRNTTSLRGNAAMGRGLVHWSGNFDEIQDFEVPIRHLFGGIGFLDDDDFLADGRDHPLGPSKAGFSADLDALAAYVASLDEDDRSPHRGADGTLTADGIAGRVVFTQLDCQRCHAGEAYTDSASGARHDVGTLAAGSGQRLGGALLALDTPTLRGLFDSSPYLHDGSAATLLDVLVARNPDGAHGDVASLDATQRNQLLAFLQQIDGSEPGVAAAAELALTSPVAGAVFAPNQTMMLSIATDLPQIQRVDYLANGAVIASATSAPWSANWNASGSGVIAIHARATHDGGRFVTLSPPVSVTTLAAEVFRDGFEQP
jgi:DNA-binding beta-propeller fold protein YncE